MRRFVIRWLGLSVVAAVGAAVGWKITGWFAKPEWWDRAGENDEPCPDYVDPRWA